MWKRSQGVLKVQYSLLVSDIDGTLYLRGKLAPSVCASVDVLKKCGCEVTFATGRNIWEAQPFVEALGITLPVVLASGAQVYNYGRGHLLYAQDMDMALILEFWKQYIPNVKYLCISDGTRCVNVSANDLEHFRGPVKRLTFTSEAPVVEKQDWPFWLFCDGESTYELTPKRADKGHGLQMLAGLLGKDMQSIIALGNDQNDITLLKTAGLGLAVETAHPALKAVSDGVVPVVDGNPLYLLEQCACGKIPWERIVSQS